MPPQIHPSTLRPAALLSLLSPHNLNPSDFDTLRERAQAAKALAYCPYSNFHVGAALLTQSGDIVVGGNVENASYPVTTCAERVAFGTAVVQGYHGKEKGGFKAIAVATDVAPPASPCGMCRQFIREFCDVSVPIIMFDKDSNFVIMTLEELLPLSFGPEFLGVPGPLKPTASQA